MKAGGKTSSTNQNISASKGEVHFTGIVQCRELPDAAKFDEIYCKVEWQKRINLKCYNYPKKEQ